LSISVCINSFFNILKIFYLFFAFNEIKSVFFYFSIDAATVVSMIVIQENAKVGKDAARKSDYGVSVNESKRIFFVHFFKRSRLP